MLVTGATGFVAQHTIRQLLDAGHQVRATLRTSPREAEVRQAVGKNGDVLDLFEADLTGDEGWAGAVDGADGVIHIASPFPRVQPKDESALIEAARDGTLRVLRFAKAAGVRRVVVTSSMNAVAGSAQKARGGRYTPEDWADANDRRLSPYDLSKLLAEQATWAFAADHPELELVAIAPGAILGPLLGPRPSSSADIVRFLMEGRAPGIPQIGFAPVDVRDVATALVSGLFVPEARGKRFLACLDHVWLEEVAGILSDRYRSDGWPIPTRTLPNTIVRVAALFSPTMRRTAHVLGHVRHVDTSDTRSILDWKPRGIEEMVLAMADSLIAHEIIQKPLK